MADERTKKEPLSVTHPELAKEWDFDKNAPITPDSVTKGCNTKFWWKCAKGHVWKAMVVKRTSGRGCPYCSGRKILAGYNDLHTLKPELMSEWNYEKNLPITPYDVTVMSSKKIWWKCQHGHEWFTAVYHRSNGKSCPECAKKAIADKNRKPHDKYLKELNYANPNVELVGYYSGTKNKILTRCLLCNSTWEAYPSDLLNGIVCPSCSKKSQIKKRYRTILNQTGSLQDVYPEIAKTWHPTLNGEISPSSVMRGSSRRAWWVCEKGHVWCSSISSRVRGLGCPYCSGKKALVGFNDLATVKPELAKEWHPSFNGELTPQGVTSGSSKQVWWKCEKGHEWRAVVYSRVHGNGCPYCSGKKAVKGYNDLKTTNPELAAEWHPSLNGDLSPSDIMAGSEKKVWWICSKGHEWKAIVYNRLKGNGCPICSNQSVLKGYNDLKTTNPKIAAEWHPDKNGELLPDMFTSGSGKKIWWICSKGHEWQTSIHDRAGERHTGCPVCNAEQQTSFPEQTIFFYVSQHFEAENRYKTNGKEIDVYIPSLKTGIEYDGAFYHASKEAKTREKQKDEYFQKNGIRIIRVKESDTNKVEGDTVEYRCNYAYDDLPWALNQVFTLLGVLQSVPDIDILRDRDSIYSLFVEKEKENSLARKMPYLLAEWNYERNSISPYAVSFSSMKKVFWTCKEGHVWEARVNTRAQGRGCPICGQKKRTASRQRTVLEKTGSLQEKYPDIASEWHPTKNGDLLPSDVTSASNKRVWWICQEGHEWLTAINNRKNGTGCPVCGTKNMADKLRKANDVFLEEVQRANSNNILLGEYVGNKVKILTRCSTCNYEWLANPNDLLRGRSCPKCAKNYPKKVRCVETGEQYDSIASAYRATGIKNISRSLCGQNKTAGGYHWEYCKENNASE